MAVAAARGRQRERQQPQEQEQEQQPPSGAAADGGRALSGQSYWLDLWLFLLFDLALFVVIYLLP